MKFRNLLQEPPLAHSRTGAASSDPEPGCLCAAGPGALACCAGPWQPPVGPQHHCSRSCPSLPPCTSLCVCNTAAQFSMNPCINHFAQRADGQHSLAQRGRTVGTGAGLGHSWLVPQLLCREIAPGYKLCTYPGVSSQPRVHNTNWVNWECEFQGMTWEIHSSHIIWGKSAEDRLAGFHPLSAHGEKQSNTVGCDHQEWEHRNADL